MAFQSSIVRLVETRGSILEKQIVARWRQPIDDFLAAFATGVQRDYQRLEIGLETAPVLKLVVKRYRTPPVEGLSRLLADLPGLAGDCAREAIRTGLDFHVGLRVQADRCHREIYVYDRDQAFSRFLGERIAMPTCPEGARNVTAFGIDERDGVSAYLTVWKNPRVAARLPSFGAMLERELKVPVADHLLDLWEHLRLVDGHWTTGKFGLELRDVDLALATRIISHYRPPHFAYLAPFAEYSNIVIAGAATGGVKGWYFTRSRQRESYAAGPAREGPGDQP